MLFWDFSIVSDVSSQHDHLEITFVLKQSNGVLLIDIVIPGDSRFLHKSTAG